MPANPTSTIVFIRHGETDWNVDGRFQGQQDIPLNEKGRSQARRNGLKLLDDMPETAAFDFVASPLSRTRETMEIVRSAMGLDPKAYRLDPILKELTFGDWEGLLIDELEVKWPDETAARERDKWNFRPPRGESYADLSARVAVWLATVKVDTVVVAHGGVSRVLRGLLFGLDPIETSMLDVPQDKVFVWNGQSASWI